MEDNQISIVIPAYNEENAIAESIQSVNQVMSETNFTYEVIVLTTEAQTGPQSLPEKSKQL